MPNSANDARKSTQVGTHKPNMIKLILGSLSIGEIAVCCESTFSGNPVALNSHPKNGITFKAGLHSAC